MKDILLEKEISVIIILPVIVWNEPFDRVEKIKEEIKDTGPDDAAACT